MPAPSSLLSKQTLPTVGEIIFGHTEEDDRGEGKRRFIWWNFATPQDRNFANLLLGKSTYSSGKLEKKLVIRNPDDSNWTLFLLAKALHFRDMDYFVDLLQRNGEKPPELNLGCPLNIWLARTVAGIVPEFLQELRRKTSSHSATTHCELLAPSF